MGQTLKVTNRERDTGESEAEGETEGGDQKRRKEQETEKKKQETEKKEWRGKERDSKGEKDRME